MGTFVGHIATGVFYFVRGLGLRMTASMRTKDRWILLPPLLTILGGVIYTVGEYYTLLTGIYSPMSHKQHFLMSIWFVLGGFAQWLHMKRILVGVGFYLFEPMMFLALAVMFVSHPQPLSSLNVGHKVMGISFTLLALVEALMFTVSHCLNTSHNASQVLRQNGRERGSGKEACSCGCAVQNSTICPVYNNPVMYTTGLPILQSFLLMLVGVVDCSMAATFFRRKYYDVSWDDLAMEEMGPMEGAMEGMDSHAGGDMNAESQALWHLMLVFVIQLVAAVILKYIDRRSQPPSNTGNTNNSPPGWEDELFNLAPSRLSPSLA